MKRKPIATSIFTVVFSLLLTGCQSVSAPEAILPVPQEKQVNWQKMETLLLTCLTKHALTLLN